MHVSKYRLMMQHHLNLRRRRSRRSGEKEERNTETYLVYFKCLISDETVMNAKMCLGGIGVAVFGSRSLDRCVFQFQKPVGVNDAHHRQVVQLQSLIEFLNSAVALGMTRILVYSNSYPVYQYFTGSLKPSTNNDIIATLVRQLNLIRRNFTYVSCHLVGRHQFRLADKLARDAISTQVTNFLESSTNMIKTSVNQDKFYCPFLNCSALMSRTKLQAELDTATSSQQETGMRKCVECDRLFCMNCQVPWHPNITCSDFMNYLSDKYSIDPQLKSLAVKNNLLQCENCMDTIERAAGCYYISCRSCGYEFCYKCGAEWKNNEPTCRCPIQDRRKHC